MYYYILNPAAGRGAITGIQDKLKERLQELGIDGEFAKTTGPGDATRMAKQAVDSGSSTIVVVGGDGTVNEVVNGITKDTVAVGIIPIGTTNLVASRLGINGWQQACDALAARRISSYGLIAAGQNYFLSTMSLGFNESAETEVVEDTGFFGRAKRALGSLSRPEIAGESLQAKLSIDDKLELSAPLYSLSVTNLKFEDPLADNKLQITLSDQPQQDSGLFGRMRGASEDDGISRFQAKKVIIETTPKTAISIDGKPTGNTPIVIRLTSRQIRFITEKQIATFRTAQ